MFLIIMGCIIVVGLLISFFGLPMEKSVSVNATVIMKDNFGEEYGELYSLGRFSRAFPARRVTFELENKKSVTLIIPGRTYNSISIGSTGILEYVIGSKRFKRFTLNEIN